MEQSCRACLRKCGMGAKNLFQCSKKFTVGTFSCAHMLAACSTLTIKENDGFPTKLCVQCYKKLCSAFKFRLRCASSYLELSNRMNVDVDLEPIKIEKNEDESCSLSSTLIIECKEIKPEADVEDIDQDSIKSENVDSDTNYENEMNHMDDTDSCKIKLSPDISLDKEKRKKKRFKEKLKKSSEELVISGKVHKCMFCPKTFKWRHLLITHQETHFDIKRYFCEICNKAYRNEKDHKNFHRRGFKFQCDTCAKFFNTKAKLAIHKVTHSSERTQLYCDVDGCKKSFLSATGLERHKLAHTGNKNFICQMCSKSFIDKYQLEIHLRIHTNDRRFPCGFCDKKFITGSARRSHEKWHTKTINYICKYCEKGFVSTSGLKRHILCHTKEQKEECRFCGKKFSRFDNRKRHEILTHRLDHQTECFQNDASLSAPSVKSPSSKSAFSDVSEGKLQIIS